MKRHFVLLACLFLTIGAIAGKRELEKNIIGVWLVDEEATVEHYRKSKKASDKSESELRASIKKLRAFVRSADLEFQFRPYALTVTNKGNSTVHSLQTNRAAGKIIVFNSSQKSVKTHRNIEFRVTFLSDDTITIDSSDSKDLDIYVWKRVPEKKRK